MADSVILDPSREAAGRWPVRNLIENPSMEVNITNWSSWNGTPLRDTTNFVRGVASLKITTTGGAAQEGAYYPTPLVTSSKTYSGMVAFRPPTTASYFLQLYGADGGGGQNGTTVACTSGVWTWLKCEGWTPGVSSTRAAFLVNKVGGNYSNGNVMYFDCFMLVEGATIGEYADGAQAGCVWEGTAHASISRQLGPVNRIVNPTFEVDATNWATYDPAHAGSLVSAQSTFWAKQGVSSLHYSAVQQAGGTTLGPCSNLLTSLATGGVTYTAAVWVNGIQIPGPTLCYVVVEFFDPVGGYISGTGPSAYITTGVHQYTLTAAAPAQACTMRMLVIAQPLTAGQIFEVYVDAAQMVAESSAGTYFDGDYADSPIDESHWSATAHASASFLIPQRGPLDINSGAIQVHAADESAGIDWGDADFEPYLADLARGSIPVDYRLPNRTITIPLLLQASGSTTFAQSKASLQEKVAVMQAEGGWLKRGRTEGDLYADIIGASLSLPDSWMGVNRSTEPNAVLTLTATPDFYGPEVALASHSETTLPDLVFTESAVSGNFPGRARLVITEAQAADQLGIIAAFRSRYYDAAPTAKLAYEAEELTVLDTAAIATRSGASGGGSNNVVRHSAINATWTPILSSYVAGVGDMTQKGVYRVMARVYSPAPINSGPTKLRLTYDVGDLLSWVTNDSVEFLMADNFWVADLGQVTLTPTPVGTYRWQFQIQGIGAGGETIDIDRVWLVPIAESCSIARANIAGQLFTSFSAIDRFTQGAGNLSGGKTTNNITAATNATPIVVTVNAHGLSNGDLVWIEGVVGNNAANSAAASGTHTAGSLFTVAGSAANTFQLANTVGSGAWTSGGTVQKVGKTLTVGGGWFGLGGNDLTIDTADAWTQRTSVSEGAGFGNGRHSFVGTPALAGCSVQVDLGKNALPTYGPGPTDLYHGIIARYQNQPNCLLAVIHVYTTYITTVAYVEVIKVISNTATTLSQTLANGLLDVKASPNQQIRLDVDAAGKWTVYQQGAGGTATLIDSGYDSVLSTGGTLASGKVGIFDYHTSAGAITRVYDNFIAHPVTSDAAMFASQKAQLTTDGNFRIDPAGTAYGPISNSTGPLLRVPPTIENRTLQCFVKASRGDFEALADPNIDDISAQLFYRPSWLSVPG